MLIGGSRREQVLFAGVMKELLAPINNPRYVIIGKEWGVRAYCVSFPCPSVFARRQQDAEILSRQLDRCLTHCTMVYARTEEGRHTLLRCQTRSFLNRDEQLPHILTTTVVPEKLRTLDRGRPWRDSQFASTRLSPSRDMSR